MAWAWIAGGSVALSAGSAILGGQAANAAAAQSQKDVQERLILQSKIADNMIAEEQSDVFQKMTDVNREFMKAKGTMTAAQANSGVTGKSSQRVGFMLSAKTSEAKSKILKEGETNAINVANDMMGKAMDAQASINRLESQKKSSASIMMDALGAGVSAYMSVDKFSKTDLGGNIEDYFKKS